MPSASNQLSLNNYGAAIPPYLMGVNCRIPMLNVTLCLYGYLQLVTLFEAKKITSKLK